MCVHECAGMCRRVHGCACVCTRVHACACVHMCMFRCARVCAHVGASVIRGLSIH